MPKKFKGENSKAAEAKARKEATRSAEVERKQKLVEDAYWADDDKHVGRKMQRKEDKEQKRVEQLRRKQEAAKLLEEETASIKTAAKVQPASNKLTRAQIDENKRIVAAEAAAARAVGELPVTELPLEENLNRMQIEGEARTVEDAIGILGKDKGAVDMHPEKRVKAAFNTFEERRLPELKAENPNLRLSQLKQILKKEWQKCPDNPLAFR